MLKNEKIYVWRMHPNVFKIDWSSNKTKDKDVTEDSTTKAKKCLRSFHRQRPYDDIFLDKETFNLQFYLVHIKLTLYTFVKTYALGKKKKLMGPDIFWFSVGLDWSSKHGEGGS